MQVITRITSIASSNPSPVYQENKNRLNEICLRSFVNAFQDIKPFVTFLADNCTCTDMIDEVCTFDHDIVKSMSNINATMLKSYDLASEMEGNVIFQECDYLYSGVIGKKYEEAISTLGFVSPYDHPNFYNAREYHAINCDIVLVGSEHYRSTERNTMTWGTTADLVRRNKDILDKYGYLDGDVWYELLERGHKLWTPIPSFATHMVKDYLSPSVDWKNIWEHYDKQVKFT